jgi:hypothetical protein
VALSGLLIKHWANKSFLFLKLQILIMKQKQYIRRVSSVNQLAIPKDFLDEIAPGLLRPSFKLSCISSQHKIIMELLE